MAMNLSKAALKILTDKGETWTDFESQPYDCSRCPARAWNDGWGGQCQAKPDRKHGFEILPEHSEIMVPAGWLMRPYETDSFKKPFGEMNCFLCKGHTKEFNERGQVWTGYYSQPPPNLTLRWKFKTLAGRGKKQEQGAKDNILKLIEIKKQMFGDDLSLGVSNLFTYETWEEVADKVPGGVAGFLAAEALLDLAQEPAPESVPTAEDKFVKRWVSKCDKNNPKGLSFLDWRKSKKSRREAYSDDLDKKFSVDGKVSEQKRKELFNRVCEEYKKQ